MATPCDRPAAADLGARVTSAAQSLGVADPMEGKLGELFRRTFARRAGDPAYGKNRLQPGALPLEWSFSEVEPDVLRVELQPFDPDLTPEDRLERATAELMPLVRAHHGEALAARFERVAKGDACERHRRPKFGAFLGLVLRHDRAPELKIYVELDPEHQAGWYGDASRLARGVPHFRSVAVGAAGLAERTYFLCVNGLRLLDLEAWCADLGMPHRFPALLMTVLELTSGEFYLPPRSVLLGVRHAGPDPELKVELVSGLAMDPQALTGRIERLLQPDTVHAFRRWAGIVHPEAPRALAVSVVSVRVSANQPARLSVYAAEPRSES